jgi:ATP-binding cassette, subfamily B, bacterial
LIRPNSYRQLDSKDCGPTCLRIVAGYYGKYISLDFLRNKSEYGKDGVSLLGIANAAEAIGFKSVGCRLSFEQLMNEAPLPAILHWDQHHFVVLTAKSSKCKLIIADPARGLVKLNRNEFLAHWLSDSYQNENKGIALLLEKTETFDKMNVVQTESPDGSMGWAYLFSLIKKNKAHFIQIMLGMIISSILQLSFPYLTQRIVDKGIKNQDLSFIKVVLVAQLMLLFSQTVVEIIKNRILLRLSTKINASLLYSFWSKLLKLPLDFFENKNAGDIFQRIGDHQKIDGFLSGPALNTTFSMLMLILFAVVLFKYNATIFGIFAISSALYLFSIRMFLKSRRTLDYKRFSVLGKENDATMQLVYGIQELKLNNAENTYRHNWERLQAELFKLSFKSLSLAQAQTLGGFFINQGKSILITFLVAKLVVEGKLTLGAMLSIQYIMGQLNGPIEQLSSFSQQGQDAKIAMERLNDIHRLREEEPPYMEFNHFLPEAHPIVIRGLTYAYRGAGNEPVLKNISTEIPQGKVTAIVGMSGSGKSTLLKILLRFYETYEGDIYVGPLNFRTISPKCWRSLVGAVMQVPFIFNDNIQKNITLTDEQVDNSRLINACRIANILPFIESAPLGFNTNIGADGNGISGGQRQRIAIARAIYKEPQFLFFDEATNALDAINEKIIIEGLQQFFKGRTVIFVAHRLSTVRNADKIIVMAGGEIVEEGNHEELMRIKGKYSELVINQLE